MKKSTYESNITKYYWYKILTSPFLLGPILAIFLLSRGLSLFEVFMLQAVFAIIQIVFEIPTGAFSDLLGRKKAMILSSSIFTAAIVIYVFSYSFL